MNIYVNGALQTGQQTILSLTPTQYTTTFAGDWSTVDDLRILFTRDRLGGGGPSGQDDDIRLYQAYAVVGVYETKTPPVLAMTGYIWENEDGSTADDSTQIAAGNTAISAPQGSRLNLRVQLKNTSNELNIENIGLFYDKSDGYWSKVRQFEVKNTSTEANAAAIETTNDVGKYSSMAIDSSGKPWISYYDTTNSGLRVANYVGTGGSGCASSAWTCTAVDTTNDVGQYSSIAFDPAGNAWVSYYDANSNNDLRVAKYVGSSGTGCASSAWTCSALETTNDVGQYSSIAFDPSGNYWISHYDNSGGNSRVAYFDRRGGITTGPLQRVASGATISESHADMSSTGDTSNRDDADCLGGGTWNNGKVFAAEQGGGLSIPDGTGTAQCTEVTFTIDLTNADANTTYRFMIATDDGPQQDKGKWRGVASVSSGATPAVTVLESYFRAAKDNSPRMANCTNTAWGCEDVIIDTGHDMGVHAKMAIDQNGMPWIVSFSDTDNALEVSVYVGSGGTGCTSSAWTCTLITNVGSVSVGNDFILSLAFAPDGTAWTSFFDDDTSQLVVAHYVGSGGIGCTLSSAWSCEYVTDIVDYAGEFTSMAFDTAGTLWVVSSNELNDNLVVVRYVGAGGTGCLSSAWECVEIDALNVNEKPSLAFDQNGIPWISYHYSPSEDLKLAHFVGPGGGTGCTETSAWTCENIDTTGDAGNQSSLGFDPSGVPWISFRDGTNNYLKVAKYVGGTSGTGCSNTAWTCTTVDTNNGGDDSSLAFDANGLPWVAHKGFNDFINVSRYVGGGNGGGCASSDWTCEVVDGTNFINGWITLAFDHTGTPWISFQSDYTDGLTVMKMHDPPSPPSAASYSRFAPRSAQKNDARYRSTLGRASADSDGICTGTADYGGACALFHANGDYDTITAQANQRPYLTFAFKYDTNAELPLAQWVGSTSLAPNTSGTAGDMYLQIYRYGSTNAWETLASDTTSASCTDCTLGGQPSGTPSEYFHTDESGKYWVYYRLYQEASTSSSITFKTDQFKAATNDMRNRLGSYFLDNYRRPLNRR